MCSVNVFLLHEIYPFPQNIFCSHNCFVSRSVNCDDGKLSAITKIPNTILTSKTRHRFRCHNDMEPPISMNGLQLPCCTDAFHLSGPSPKTPPACAASTCNSLPLYRISITWLTLPGTGNHPGLYRTSQISNDCRKIGHVARWCYPSFPYCMSGIQPA